MKYRTTRKEIIYNYGTNNIFQLGYCELEPLKRFFDEAAYNCGVYGWNFDVIEVGRRAILTGYRGMFGRELPEKAARILENAKTYDKKRRAGGCVIPYEQREKYMKRAARRFAAALENCDK